MFKKDILIKLKCAHCGKEFNRPKWRHQDHLKRGDTKQFCSAICRNQYQVGKDNFNFKQGYTINTGYKRSSFGPNKGRYLHNIIMEDYLGRKLAKNECVHHLDGDRANNHPDNLSLCINHSAHLKKYHTKKGRRGFTTSTIYGEGSNLQWRQDGQTRRLPDNTRRRRNSNESSKERKVIRRKVCKRV